MSSTVQITKERAAELLKQYRPEGVREIILRAEVHEGLSGATVWHIDVQSDSLHNGFAIAKFDDYERLRKEKEQTEAARHHPVIESRSPRVLHLSPQIVEEDQDGRQYKIGFLLEAYALDPKAYQIDTLQKHIERHRRENRARILDQVTALISPLFAQLYGQRGWSMTRSTISIFDEFGKTLNLATTRDRAADLPERMHEFFGIESSTQRLIIDIPSGNDHPRSLENPAYVMLNPALWHGQAITAASCLTHGDLHTGNVICQLQRNYERPTDAFPWLIDFANFRYEGLFFYDLAQLEFDILCQYLPCETADDWHDWSKLLTYISRDEILPDGEPTGDRAPSAWSLIKPIRQFVHHYISETRHSTSGIDEELRRAWWLSVLILGVRAAQRSQLSHGLRSAGLVYAALSLRYLPHEILPDPSALTVLSWQEDQHGLRAKEKSQPVSSATKPRVQKFRTRGSQLCTPHEYKMKTTFVGRKSEFKTLDKWARSEDTIMQVVAIGGQGKSALTWEWFGKRTLSVIPNLSGAIWWSFYESDGAMGCFLESALSLLGHYRTAEIEQMSREEREDTLLDLSQEKSLLFVFDGLERILNAYRNLHDATQTDDETDEQVKAGEGKQFEHPRACANPQDSAFLRRLLVEGRAKVLISTRLKLHDFEDEQEEPKNGVATLELHGLSDDDVLELMAHYRISGNRWQIIDFARSFESHGLLLKLIIGKIRTFTPARGDFDTWYEREGKDLNLRTLDMKQKRTHILKFALEALSADARALLRRLSVYNYAFDYDAALAIHPFADRYYVPPDIPPAPFSKDEYEQKQHQRDQADREWLTAPSGSQEEKDADARRKALEAEIETYANWQEAYGALEQAARAAARKQGEPNLDHALYELEDRGLITHNFFRRTWDMHPVVRGYAYHDLKEDAAGYSETLGEAINYFEKSESTPAEDVKELDDLRRELEIYRATVDAGNFDRAIQIYNSKLGSILFYQLNAFHEIVRLLSPLFRDGFTSPPTLTERNYQTSCIQSLGIAYRQIDVNTAVQLYTLNMRLLLDEKDTSDLVGAIWNYSLLDLVGLGSAIAHLRLGLRMAEAAEAAESTAQMRRLLFQRSVDIGAWAEAEAWLAQVKPDDFDAGLRSMWESEMRCSEAEMFMLQGRDYQPVLTKAERLAYQSRSPYHLRSVEQLYGEAALLEGDGTTASRRFERLLELLQMVRLSVENARGGLARALLLQGKHAEARAQIEAGADHLSAAEVWLALGEREQAEKAALAAYKKLWGEGKPYTPYELPRAEAVLKELHVPIPMLPEWDESKRVRLPEEDRIIAYIEELEAKQAEKAVKSTVPFEDWIELLKADDTEQRVRAINALAQLGDDRAVEPIIKQLDDSRTRRAAVSALGKLHSSDAVQPLLEVIVSETDGDARASIANALSQIGQIDPLAVAATDPRPRIRRAAITAIRDLGEPSSRPLIVSALNDKDWKTSFNALQGLNQKQFRSPLNVESLVSALSNDFAKVRWTAAEVLAEYTAYSTTTVVTTLCDTLNDPVIAVRRAALQTLSKIGDATALASVINCLRDLNATIREEAAETVEAVGGVQRLRANDAVAYWIVRENWDRCRQNQAVALGMLIDDLLAADPLLRLRALRGLEAVRWQAQTAEERGCEAFARNQWDKCVGLGNDALPVLVEGLRYAVDDHLRSIITTLEQLGWQPITDNDQTLFELAHANWERCVALGAVAVHTLIRVLYGSNDEDLQMNIAQCLGTIGDERAVPALKDAMTLNLSGSDFRKAMCHALNTLGFAYDENDA